MKDPSQRLEHLGTYLTLAVDQERIWNELYQQVVPRSWGKRERDHPKIIFLNMLWRLVNFQGVEGCRVSGTESCSLVIIVFPTGAQRCQWRAWPSWPDWDPWRDRRQGKARHLSLIPVWDGNLDHHGGKTWCSWCVLGVPGPPLALPKSHWCILSPLLLVSVSLQTLPLFSDRVDCLKQFPGPILARIDSVGVFPCSSR